MEIPLKGSWIDPTLIKTFPTFEEFYKWGDPIFKGTKSEFEKVYYEVMPKKTKGGE